MFTDESGNIRLILQNITLVYLPLTPKRDRALTTTFRESLVIYSHASSEKRPFAPSVSGIRLPCYVCSEGQVSFCEMSAMVTNCVTDPPRWFCDCLREVHDCRENIVLSALI